MPSVSCDRDIINYITLGELLKVTGYLQDFQTLRKSCLRCTTSRSRSACHQFAKWHTESFERKDPQGKVEIQFHGHYKEIFPFYEPLTEMTEKVFYCFWIPVRFVRGMTGLFSCNELLPFKLQESRSDLPKVPILTLPGYIKLHFTNLWLVQDNDWHFIGHLDWLTTVISKGKDALFYQIHTYAFSFPMNILLG